jgi:hypothetical protein
MPTVIPYTMKDGKRPKPLNRKANPTIISVAVLCFVKNKSIIITHSVNCKPLFNIGYQKNA